MLKYVAGFLWEPSAAHAKWVLLALAVMSGQLMLYALVFFMFAFLLPGLLLFAHQVSGVRSLKALADRMRESSPTLWIKVAPFSRAELIERFGLIQLNALHNKTSDLFFIKRKGSAELNHYCYISGLSNTYVETVNAEVDLDDLPAAQKFMIYHELAHASFSGGDHWVALRAEVLFVPITILLLIQFLHRDASLWLLSPVAILAFFVVSHAMRYYRNITSEKAADRTALRWMCRESPEEAIRIGRMLIRRWSSNKNVGMTAERRKSMASFVRTIEDWRDGKTTVDPDRVPWPLALPFHFLFAATSVFMIVFWGRAPSGEETEALCLFAVIAFSLLMLVGTAYKVKLVRLDAYVQSRFTDAQVYD